MDTKTLGLIGVGAISEQHLRAFSALPDVELVAVANRGPEPRDRAQARFGIPRGYADFREMLARERLDAACVLVGATDVYDVTCACLEHALPLLVEKPPGLSVAETEDLARRARARRVPVMVGLNRRFYSVIRKAREAIAERGPLLGITVNTPERVNEKKAIEKFAPVIDRWLFLNGIHGIDLFRFLGGEIRRVTTAHAALHEKNGDSFAALAEFASGALGHYVSHWQSPGSWTVDLYGDGIRAHLEPLERGWILRNAGEPVAIEPDEVDTTHKPGFWAQARYFVDRLHDGAPIGHPASSIDDALETMKLVEAIGA
jgi:predicted dehydrogenase